MFLGGKCWYLIHNVHVFIFKYWYDYLLLLYILSCLIHKICSIDVIDTCTFTNEQYYTPSLHLPSNTLYKKLQFALNKNCWKKKLIFKIIILSFVNLSLIDQLLCVNCSKSDNRSNLLKKTHLDEYFNVLPVYWKWKFHCVTWLYIYSPLMSA